MGSKALVTGKSSPGPRVGGHGEECYPPLLGTGTAGGESREDRETGRGEERTRTGDRSGCPGESRGLETGGGRTSGI